MIRAAALVAGDGAMLQGILDSIYFKEFPDFKLEAVICPRKEDYAMVRAIRAEIPSFVVDPDLFPTSISHSMAVANKLKDMELEKEILLIKKQLLMIYNQRCLLRKKKELQLLRN